MYNKKVFPESSTSDLFYSPSSSLLFCKCSDTRCKTSLNASTSQITKKTSSSLDIKYNNHKYQNDYVSVYSLINHQLNKKLQELKKENQKFLKLIIKI